MHAKVDPASEAEPGADLGKTLPLQDPGAGAMEDFPEGGGLQRPCEPHDSQVRAAAEVDGAAETSVAPRSTVVPSTVVDVIQVGPLRVLRPRSCEATLNASEWLEEPAARSAAARDPERDPEEGTLDSRVQYSTPATPRSTINLDERVLAERIQLYRTFATEMHGRDHVPPWLHESLHEVEVTAARAHSLRHSLRQQAERGARLDHEFTATRLQIEQALAQLARDEFRLNEGMPALRWRAQCVAEVLERLSDELVRCVACAQVQPGAWMGELYRIASGFAGQRGQLLTLRQEIAAKVRAQEDLSQQIRELRASLEAYEAQSLTMREGLAVEADGVSQELRELIARMIQGLDRIYVHLASFPELRDRLEDPLR